MAHEKYFEFIRYCEKETNIRTVVLTSSRGRSLEGIDQFSDYDLELYVRDIEPFMKNDEWIECFGKILVRWPLCPKSTAMENFITRLIQFSDGIRFDFQITSNTIKYHSNFDAGYQVVVDKDQTAFGLSNPRYESFFVQKPTKSQFEERLNSFYWDSLYVAKNLWRDEFFYAKYMLDNALRFSCLQELLEWHIGQKENWNVNTGKYGGLFQKYLDKALWKKVQLTFAGSDIEQNWKALETMLDVVHEISVPLAEELSVPYPTELEEGIREYIEKVHHTPRNKS